MTILAIDPGKAGAIAYQSGLGIVAHPLPLAGKELDLAAIAKEIYVAAPSLIVIEKVGAMPGNGGVSMFTFGKGYGALLGIAAAYAIPVELVTPQAWKAAILAGTAKDKDAAIAYCRRVFPAVPLVPKGCRKPHDGIADALCLLEYGRRKFAQAA